MIPIKRTCDVENIGDFNRYYNNSWVGWHSKETETITPCYVGGMVDADRLQLSPLTKIDSGHIIGKSFQVSWAQLNEQVDFGMPDIGMMPDGPSITFRSYATPRVARKGFRFRETKTTDFNHWDIRKKYTARIDRGGERYDLTWFAFNPEYLTLEQAEDKLNKGEMVGLPLSRTLGVYSIANSKHSLLAYKRWTVGHVISPYLINIKREYGDYEEDIALQTGAEVIVR